MTDLIKIASKYLFKIYFYPLWNKIIIERYIRFVLVYFYFFGALKLIICAFIKAKILIEFSRWQIRITRMANFANWISAILNYFCQVLTFWNIGVKFSYGIWSLNCYMNIIPSFRLIFKIFVSSKILVFLVWYLDRLFNNIKLITYNLMLVLFVYQININI